MKTKLRRMAGSPGSAGSVEHGTAERPRMCGMDGVVSS